MAAITWRDVTAPDFSAAQEGYRQFSSLLNGAFGAAERGIERFDNTLDERAQRALAAAAQRYRDPAELEAAMASGAIYEGIDQNRLGAADYGSVDAALANRFGIARTGLEIEGQTETNRSTKWTNARNETRAGTMDALAPHIAQAASIAAAGNPEEAHQMMTRAIAAEGIEGMTPSEVMALYTGGQEIATGEQRYRQGTQQLKAGELQYDRNKFDYDQAIEGEAEKDAADNAWRTLASRAIDAEGARELLFGDEFRNLPPAVFNTLLGRVDASFGTPGGPGAAPDGGAGNHPADVGLGEIGAPSGGFAGGAPNSSRVLNYEARAAGFNALPENVRTVGDVSDYAIRMNRAGVGSSATGTYQIVGQTLRGKNNQNGYAERVLGRNWRTAEWTPEVEDRIAEAIFNDHRNSATALRQQWVSLSPAEAERVRQMPWAEARRVIAQKESGARIPPPGPGASPTESRAAAILDAEARGLGNQNGLTGNSLALATGYMEAQGRANLGLRDVATGLTSENGRFSGVDRARVEDELQYFMNKHDVSASVAAWALEGGLRQRGVGDRLRNIAGTNQDFSGRQIDRGASDRLIADALEGNLASEVNQVELMVGNQASRAQAEAAAAQARTNLQWAIRQNEIRGGGVDISRYRRALEVAEAALGPANIERGSNPTQTPRRTPAPAARPARVSAPPLRRSAPARTPAPRMTRVDDFLLGSD